MSVVPQREIKARSGTPVGAVRTGAGIAEPVPGERLTVRGFFAVFKHSRRAIELVWSTNSVLSVALALLTLIAGVLPAAIAYVGSLIVDSVVHAMRAGGADSARVVDFVLLEGMLVAAVAATQRGISLCQSLLRAQLGQRVNVMILEKALTLELQHFEDSEFYDKLTRARREASSRPLSLIMRTFGLVQNGISLVNRTGLPELIWVLRRSSFIVSVDSGPMHIGAAITSELLSIHLWSDPGTVGPYNPDAWIWKDRRIVQVRSNQTGESRPGIDRRPDMAQIAGFVCDRLLH